MSLLYKPSKLRQRFSNLLVEAETAPEIREGLARAFVEESELATILTEDQDPILQAIRHRVDEIYGEEAERLVRQISAALAARAYGEASNLINTAFKPGRTLGSAPSETQSVARLVIFAIAQRISGDREAMVHTLRLLVDSFGKSNSVFVQKCLGACHGGNSNS